MSERLTDTRMAAELAKLAWSKETWLGAFAVEGRQRRPEMEIDTKRRELAVLRQAADEYSAWAKTRSEPAA